jgi:nucleoside phosphorylase
VRILVTFALENEFAPWCAVRDFKSAKLGDADIQLSQINSLEVAVALTGVGARRAAIVASEIMRSEYDAFDACISCGLAGGLRSDYHVGEVLAARSVFSEAPREDESSRLLQSSEALVSFAAECGAIVVNQFFSADHVVSRADEKKHLGETADAVEMESFEIMRVAQGVGVPAIVIRAISDTVSEDLPLDMKDIFTDQGQVSIPRVLGQVALRPQSLPGLMRLGKNSRAASESLARFLDSYLVALANRAAPLEIKSAAGAF